MLNGKWLSGAAHAGHDFVGDQKDPVFAADFGDQWLVGRAASDIAADGHRAERAAVIALASRQHAVTILLAGLKVILPNQFNRRLGRFGATGSEVHAAAFAKIRGSKSEKARSKFFSLSRMKL